MTGPPTSYSSDTVERALPPFTSVSRRQVTWRQLLPAHRMPVTAKTPLLVALGLYLSGGRFDSRTAGLTMALAAGLWAVLYVLNESTDLVAEQGYYLDRRIRALLLMVPMALCLFAACVSRNLLWPFLLMTASQIAYCVPPLRVKRWWWAALLLSGALNPVLRLECGAVLGTHRIPVLAYAVFVSLHLGAAIRARSMLRERDRHLGYCAAPVATIVVGKLCTALGLAGAYLLSAQGILPHITWIFLAPSTLFAAYAWSGRASSMEQLRQCWLGFALLALIALALLFSGRFLG